MTKLENKVALITGAGRSIGREIAFTFAKEGASVAVNDIDSSAENTAAQIAQEGHNAAHFVYDVSNSKEIEKMVRAVTEKFGRIDILVNNAGIEIHKSKMLWETTEEIWDRTMDTNLKSYFLCCKFVAPLMMRQGSGIIVNISSLDGLYSSSNGNLVYNTSMSGRTIQHQGQRSLPYVSRGYGHLCCKS